jgi:DNA-binding response OmpR family regulator
MTSISERSATPKNGNGILRPNLNVLVIEDDQDTALTIGLIIIGYGVRTIPSRDEALFLLSCYLYDVIIMDLNMPGISAEDFIAEATRRCPRSQIVLLTAAGSVNQEGERLGLCHRLGKPFDDAELIRVVKSAK